MVSDSPAVRAEKLRRTFGDVTAVDSVDLEVRRGEIFGVVGPDGAGKTTLIQMLCGILDPTAGHASVLGLDTIREADALAERIGYMSQAFSLYGTLSVAENIEFFSDLRSISTRLRLERTGRLLDFSRLSPFAGRKARDLSGGMQKKLALATTLVHEPELLFLDEPTTGVDPLSRRDFWEIVFDSLAEGATVVVATPYLDEAERCSRVALMHAGRLLKVDTPARLKEILRGQMVEVHVRDTTRALHHLRRDSEVLEAQIFGRTVHALLADVFAYRRVEERLVQSGIEVEWSRYIDPTLEDVFFRLLNERADGAPPDPVTSLPHASRPAGTRTSKAQPRSATAEPDPDEADIGEPRIDEPAIEAQGLTRRFGSFVAVDSLDLRVGRGEVFGFLGPNGSGKSTTIRMLTGILRPSAGRARIAGFELATEGRRIQPRIGYMSQRFSLYDDLTAGENLDFFAGVYGVPRGETAARKAWGLEAVGLAGRERTLTADLSGGWKQRLALAAAILHRPEILFLDEPTSGVDPVSRRQFWDLIFELSATGVTVLVTTHYMDEAERCERVAFLEGGRLVAAGTPEELRETVMGRMLEVRVDEPLAALKALRAVPEVRQATLHGASLHVLVDESPAAQDRLVSALSASGHRVRRTTPTPLGMEDVFVALVGDAKTAHRRRAQ